MAVAGERISRLEAQMEDIKTQVQNTESRLSTEIGKVNDTLANFINSADSRYARKETVDTMRSALVSLMVTVIGAAIGIVVYIIQGHITF